MHPIVSFARRKVHKRNPEKLILFAELAPMLHKKDELEKTRQALMHYEEKCHLLFREKPPAGAVKRILVVDPEDAHILISHLRDRFEIICEINDEALKQSQELVFNQMKNSGYIQ